MMRLDLALADQDRTDPNPQTFWAFAYWINAVVNSPPGKQMHAEPLDVPSNGDVKAVRLVVTSPMGTSERCRFRSWPKKKT